MQRFRDDGGTLAMFSITTPFGDTTFRFVERRGLHAALPRLRARARPQPTAAGNRFGFKQIDHVTSNFQTMKPALLWMEHVLGFERSGRSRSTPTTSRRHKKREQARA